MHGLRNGAENHAGFRQFLAEGGRYGNGVKYRVYRHARKHLLLVERNAQLLVGGQQLRIYLVEALRAIFHVLGRGVIRHLIEVDRRIVHMGPLGLGHGQPIAVSAQAPFQQPFRLALLLGDKANYVFIEARRQRVGFDIRHETRGVFLVDATVDYVLRHRCSCTESRSC